MDCSPRLPDAAWSLNVGAFAQGPVKFSVGSYLPEELRHVPVVSSLLCWISATSPPNRLAANSDAQDDFLGLGGDVGEEEREVSGPASEQNRDDERVFVESARDECADRAKMIVAKRVEQTARHIETADGRADGLPSAGPPRGLASVLCSSEEGRIKVRVKAKDLKGLAADKRTAHKAGAAQSQQLRIRDAAVEFEERRITVKLVDNERGFWVFHNDLPGPIDVEESRFSVGKMGEGVDITLKKKVGKWPAQARFVKDQPAKEPWRERSGPGSAASSVAFLMMD